MYPGQPGCILGASESSRGSTRTQLFPSVERWTLGFPVRTPCLRMSLRLRFSQHLPPERLLEAPPWALSPLCSRGGGGGLTSSSLVFTCDHVMSPVTCSLVCVFR